MTDEAEPAPSPALAVPRAAWWRAGAWRGRRASFGAAGLGALAALALPPVGAVFVLLFAIPGLLALIDSARGVREAAWRGFCFGFGLSLVGFYWITEAILVEAAKFWWLVPFAVPLLAVVLALFIAAPAAAAFLARPGWRRVCVFAGTWTLADLARQFVATGFPWNPLGSVWALPGTLGTVALQPAAFVSVHGLTLFTLLIAATPSLGRRAMAAGAAALALWAGVGVARLDLAAASAPTGIKVVLVQGNIAEGQKWDPAFARSTFVRYLRLTADAMARAGKPAVVVWPETASPYLLAQDAPAREAIAAATGGEPALVGSVRFDAKGRPRNSLMAIGGDGRLEAVYDKWHLVPFGEYQPDWFPLPIQVVPGGGFAAGKGPATLTVPGLPPVGALICYEAIFPAEAVDEAHRPDWLVNVTNDAWFGNSAGPRQHLAAARLRAVEEGLPLMRAANTGISAGFDAFGREIGRLGLGRTGVLVLPLPGRLPPTPIARFGLLVPLLLAVAAALAGLLPQRRSR